MSEHGAGPRGFAPGALAVLAGWLALLVVGCAQEGKLIQVPLRVRGVAVEYDLLGQPLRDTVVTDSVSLRFKIQVGSANPCEAGHTLMELSHPLNPDRYVVTPVARYNADDKCVLEPPVAADTAQSLTVTPFDLVRDQGIDFRVTSAGEVEFTIPVNDSTLDAVAPNTVRFQVWVQHVTTGAPFPGATVAIDTLGAGGAVTPIGSGTSADPGGEFALDVPCSGLPNAVGPAYRVTVTSGAASQVFSVPSFPARCGRREQIYIRL